jgi:hypothetical protein
MMQIPMIGWGPFFHNRAPLESRVFKRLRPRLKCALSDFKPTAMRASQFFIATLKEAPSDAEIVSHKLMLRAGLIRAWPAASTPGCRWACACCARSRPSCARK